MDSYHGDIYNIKMLEVINQLISNQDQLNSVMTYCSGSLNDAVCGFIVIV